MQQILLKADTIEKPEKEKKLDVVFEIMDALAAPILTHCTSWADTIPQRLLQAVKIARLISKMKKEELATYEEVVAFIYTRKLEAPMDHDWTEIYLHCSCTVCDTHHWGNGDYWKELGAIRELSEYQKSLLKQLRQWIYDRRRKHVKETMRHQSKEKPDAIEVIEPVEQLNLFL